ncbi:TPA: hypothetical protein UOJ00_002978 [Stenotrophomonas maltophilia]|nr:hypothetical protein [Stenotrophomonas maltophilia]
MDATLKSFFLLAMAVGVILVVIQSLRTGVVHWRHGPPAATRRDNPGAYWGFIAVFVLVAAAMVAAALAT